MMKRFKRNVFKKFDLSNREIIFDSKKVQYFSVFYVFAWGFISKYFFW